MGGEYVLPCLSTNWKLLRENCKFLLLILILCVDKTWSFLEVIFLETVLSYHLYKYDSEWQLPSLSLSLSLSLSVIVIFERSISKLWTHTHIVHNLSTSSKYQTEASVCLYNIQCTICHLHCTYIIISAHAQCKSFSIFLLICLFLYIPPWMNITFFFSKKNFHTTYYIPLFYMYVCVL